MIDITWLIEHGPCKKFTAGTNIPCPGGPDKDQKAMYILLAGRVDVFKKSAATGSQMVASLIKGDVFGGREYFTEVNEFTYTAGINSAVYVINEESFSDLSWSRPEILFDVLRAAYLPMRKATAATAATAAKAAPVKAAPAKVAVTPDILAAATPATPASPSPSPTPTPTPVPVNAAEVEIKPPVQKVKQTEPVVEPVKSKAHVQKSVPGGAPGIFPEGHKQYPGITRPEFKPLVFPKEYNCPFCKKPFKDYRVFRSKLYESKPMRYDLRKYYTDFQTEWYDIISCHNCLFSTFHNYFTDPKPIQKAKIEKSLASTRADIHMDFASERDLDFVFTSHYLAILCADGYPTMGKQIRAKLWGNLSWLYEDVPDMEMEMFAALKAAEAYEQVYTESRLTPIQEQITCLSIAGMQHRAGHDNNLKKFIFTAKTLTAGDKTYAKLAEDFMYELKMED